VLLQLLVILLIVRRYSRCSFQISLRNDSQLENLNAKLATAQSDLQTANTRVQQLEDENASLKTQVKEANDNLSQSREQLTKLQAELTQAHEEIAKAKATPATTPSKPAFVPPKVDVKSTYAERSPVMTPDGQDISTLPFKERMKIFQQK